jgi:hypothetical protein
VASLGEKVADDAAVFFVVDSGEEFFAEFADCVGAIEG